MTREEFSRRMGLSEEQVARLIDGEVRLTDECACRLASVLGISPTFWIKLEAHYRARLARVAEENDMDDQVARLPKVSRSSRR